MWMTDWQVPRGGVVDRRDSKNLLLRQLSDEERLRVMPHVTEEVLAFKQPLLDQGAMVERVYFPENGVASMVVDLAEDETVETGTVGNEGLIGLPAVLAAGRSPARVFMQIPGRARVVPVAVIDRERELNSPWFRLLLRYANFVTAMIGQTAACNRLHTVDARMCRWLLMTHDRVATDNFPLTQDFLAQMLGVARPTVNIAGATLQRAGFIKYTRGRITILDRPGLESASCECYWRIRQELDVLVNGQRRMMLKATRRRVRR
jgi:CRP-like cAMP-binding protein